jgi:hypothetical protein
MGIVCIWENAVCFTLGKSFECSNVSKFGRANMGNFCRLSRRALSFGIRRGFPWELVRRVAQIVTSQLIFWFATSDMINFSGLSVHQWREVFIRCTLFPIPSRFPFVPFFCFTQSFDVGWFEMELTLPNNGYKRTHVKHKKPFVENTAPLLFRKRDDPAMTGQRSGRIRLP